MPIRSQAWLVELDWALAALAAAFWLLSWGITFYREPAVRRWFAFTWYRIRSARLSLRPVRSYERSSAASVRPLFPPANQSTLGIRTPRGNTAQAMKLAPQPEPAIRIAEWSVDHLPLRYRLLGRPRRPVNDN